jgi:hypothetical protein
MFDFFKRSTPTQATQPRREASPRRKTAVHRGLDPLAPLPTPEVTEGNSEADWSLWEDSVAVQDGQFSDPYPDTLAMPLQATENPEAKDLS